MEGSLVGFYLEFWWPAVLLILMMLLWHDLWEMDKRLQSAGFC